MPEVLFGAFGNIVFGRSVQICQIYQIVQNLVVGCGDCRVVVVTVDADYA